MIISVASGKGGTGKTTIATSLAISALEDVQLLDCDVEEPNAHIFIKPKIDSKESIGVLVPQIDANKCVLCGRCTRICAFNALAIIPNKILVFSELCHSCGACQYICPVKAINEVKKELGTIKIGQKNNIKFIQGELNIGEAIPIPIIKAVKEYIVANKLVIIDAPPGTSCPMIESTKNSDFCLLVTEPTPFGLSDLILTIEVLKKLKISYGVVINRAGLGDEKTEQYCQLNDIPILMKIPFQKEIALTYAKGIPIVEAFPEYKIIFRKVITDIMEIISRDSA